MPEEEMTQDVVKLLQELQDQQSSGDEDMIWQAFQQYLVRLDLMTAGRQGTADGAKAANGEKWLRQGIANAAQETAPQADEATAEAAERAQGRTCAESGECIEPFSMPDLHSYRYVLEDIQEEPELETAQEEQNHALRQVSQGVRHFAMMSFKSVKDVEEDDTESESPEKPNQARHFAIMSFKSIKDAEEDDAELESPEKPNQARHFAIMSFKSVMDVEEDDAESESPEKQNQARYFMMSFKSVGDIDDDDAASESDRGNSFFKGSAFDISNASTSANTLYLCNSAASLDSYTGMHDFELAFEKFSKPDKRAASYLASKFKSYLKTAMKKAAGSRGKSRDEEDEVDMMAMAIM